jgi:FlaA1/EpsC-like NDP-sugar epimerase
LSSPRARDGRVRRSRRSGYLIIVLLIVIFILMATEVIPASWIMPVVLLMVVLVLMRTTVRLILERQERLRQQGRGTPT